MSDKLKNIIKKSVNLLLEVNPGDLPRTQVVKDKGAYHTANAMDALEDIDQKFRELGISVNPNELATIDILKGLQPFNIKFKLKNSTPFFDGNTEITGKAKIDDRHKGLRLFFISDKGHKVRIDFDRKTLSAKQPQSLGDVTILMENTPYIVQLSSSKGGIEFGKVEVDINGDKKTVSGKRLGKISFLTSKKGTTYTVAPNPDKQGDVIEGSVNVTLVGDESDPQPNKSFAVPKSKLEKTPDNNEYAYFPEGGGKPQRVESKIGNNQPQTTTLIIVSLPNVKLDGDNKNGNAKFVLGKTVNVKGKLNVSGELNFENKITLDDINDKLKSGAEAQLSASKQEGDVLKITLDGDKAVMLKPKSSYPDPHSISNWNNLSVEVGSKAMGKEEWKSITGEASLNVS